MKKVTITIKDNSAFSFLVDSSLEKTIFQQIMDRMKLIGIKTLDVVSIEFEDATLDDYTY